MTRAFVHLNVHSEYSLIDSTIRVDDLARACASAGMPAVALTDDSNFFALVKFYGACESAGIKPIIGCDLWIADGTEQSRVTTLARNRAGYLRLSRLLSDAYRQRGKSERVMVPRAELLLASADLFVLLGDRSDVGRANDPERAGQLLSEWQRAFDDRVYLQVARLQRGPREDQANTQLLHMASRFDLPALAVNDVRFTAREDFEAHEARVCIATGRVLNDPKRPRDYTAEQYLKSPAEMAERFADCPVLLDNAFELAKRCNVELSFGKYFLPAYPVPKTHTLETFIRERAELGLDKRLAIHPPSGGRTEDDYRSRLKIELDVIVSMGFEGYFLIVADFINWAKDNDIPVGPGRGSGAGSLVAFALSITDIDPLPLDLLFERFLNPERVSMPDFDIDFCMEGRDRVIDYVGQKYGRDKVCQIITYGTMAAKAVVRDTGRVLGMGYGHVDSIAKLIPNTLGITLDNAVKESPELAARIETEDDCAQLIELARKLEDLTRNAGKHAGGVVIAPTALTDFAPLYCVEESDGMVTQFDKDDVEKAGLVKFDFLGLRTLTIIDWAVKAINAKRRLTGEEPLDITKIPVGDTQTYTLLKSGQTTAVFQLESRGMKELIRKLQPDNFEDIVALVALFRPGPLQSGMVDDFIARKHGKAVVSYPHASLEPILKPTYGVIVYQEQVMQIAQVLAGYTLGGADLLRRAMGKKKAEEMAQQRAIFEAGAKDNGVDPDRARGIFDLMEKFAEYGFNKSHSAAYAMVTYQTAWLKAHYPSEFMAAVCSSDMDNQEKLVNFLDDARAIGLNVLPPDVNESVFMFRATGPAEFRYGLGAIKGVGQQICEMMVEARGRGGAYTDLADLCRRLDAQRLNKRVLEALIYSGALDSLGQTRASQMNYLPEAVRAAEQELRNHQAGQTDIFGTAAATPMAPPIEPLPEWPLLRRLHGERETLGFFLSGHPADAYRDWLKQLTTCPIGQIEQAWLRGQNQTERNRGRLELPIVLGGVVPAGLRRRGDTMAFAALEDAGGRIEIALYRDTINDFGSLLSKDELVIVEGGLSPDEFSGGFQLKAKRVYTLAQALERFARGLRIRLNGVRADFPDQLAMALKPSAGGSTPVRLYYARNDVATELNLGERWRMRVLPELIDKLKGLPGVDDVELILGRATSGSSTQSANKGGD